MELYTMPQLKGSPAYSEHVPFIEGSGDVSNQSLARADVTKYGSDILSSSAWSAVIHHPAEDSEPDELPSTVDMDAIKEPPTPLPAPCTPGGGACVDSRNEQSDEDDDSGSGSDSDGESDSETGNESNTESEDGSRSSNCSWSDSDSDSPSSGEDRGGSGARRTVHRSTSSSSRSSQQSDSSPTPQHFSIRETNFDQGGLKLKISALKMPKSKVSSRDKSASSTDNERDDSSSDEKEVVEKSSKGVKHKEVSSKDLEKEKNNSKLFLDKSEVSNKPLEKKEISDIKYKSESCKIVDNSSSDLGSKVKSEVKSHVKENNNNSSSINIRTRLKTSSNNSDEKLKVEEKIKVHSKSAEVKSSKENSKTSLRHSAKESNTKTSPSETKTAKSSSPVKSNSNSTANTKQSKSASSNSSSPSLLSTTPKKGGINNSAQSTPCLGRLRSYRKDMQENKSPLKAAIGGGGGGSGGGQGRSCSSDVSDSSSEEEGDDDDDNRGAGSGDEITQLAHQLAQPPESDASIPISEHLQVINQEDLAAILPDVVGVSGGPFDGFEDVSSGEGCRVAGATGSARTCTRPGPVGPGAESSSDMELLPDVSDVINRINLDSDAGQDDEQNQHSVNSGDDTEQDEVGYSSNLLQQFNQKTEQLSVRSGNSSRSKMSADASRNSNSDAPRRKRGRPPKLSVAPPVVQQNNKLAMPPELEAYCSVSNVSPDSGIQSVAGSPSHQSCSPASNPPAHSPAPPVLSKPNPPSPPPPSVNRVHTKNVPALYSPRKKTQTSGSNGKHHCRSKEPITTNTKLTKLYTTTEELRVGNGGKRGPGRPKGSGRKKGRPPRKEDLTLPRLPIDMLKVPPFYNVKNTVVNMVENEDIPRLHGMMVPGKRGPGRPKKMPPTLEPNLPLVDRTFFPNVSSGSKIKRAGDCSNNNLGSSSSKLASDTYQKSGGSLLFENSDQGSKRADLISPVKSNKTWSELYNKNGEMKYHNARKDASKLYHQKSYTGLDKRISNRRQMIRSRTVLPRGFARVRLHKHKKRKKRLKSKIFRVDPNFLVDLEKLVEEFKKSCRITTIDESLQNKISVNESPPVLPSIFRVKRIVKKRKGSEKAKVSDKESGPELETVKEKVHTSSQTPNPVPAQAPTIVKRRPKKNAVEAPKNRDKDKSETTNNEQRLPLKKRHYHISNTSTSFQNDPQASPKSDSASSDSVKTGIKTSASSSNDKCNEKPAVTSGGGGKGCSIPKSNVCVSSGGKSSNVSKTEVKSKSETHRNSIDEAIEACINKYAVDESRSVIFTPKKRHRLEMERKDKSPGAHSRSNAGSKPDANNSCIFQPNKRASSRSSSTTNQVIQSPASPAQGPVIGAGKRSSSRSIVPVSSVPTSVISTITSGTVSNQTKRSSSRSSSVTAGNTDGTLPPTSSSNKTVIQNTISTKRSQPRNVSETTVTPVPSTELPQKRSSRLLPTPSTGEAINNSLVTSNVGSQKRAVTRSMDSDSGATSTVALKSKGGPSITQLPPSIVSISPLPVLSSNNSINVSTTSSITVSVQNTRTASKSSGNSTSSSSASLDMCPKSPRAKAVQKPPAGVFEPSSKQDIPLDPVVDLPAVLNKITERLNQIKKQSLESNLSSSETAKVVASPVATSVTSSLSTSTVISSVLVVTATATISTTTIVSAGSTACPAVNSTTTNSLTVVTTAATKTAAADASVNETSVIRKQNEEIDARSMRPKRVIDDKSEEERKGKKRKVIKDIRVHVMKLSPSDIILKKAMSTVKHKIRRRKAINRTGFPVKKKKKKKPIVDIGHMEVSSSPPPVLEDQTKLEPVVVNSPLHDMTPALTPVGKFKEENIVKVEKPKEEDPRKVEKVEKDENSQKSSNREVKEKIIRTSNRRLLQLRARAEASKRRKRKRNGILNRESSSEPASTLPPLPNKRLRKMKEDEEDESDADSTKSRKKPPPRWRKKYLVAGLFSDFYKEDEPRKASIDVGKSRIVYRPEEHKHGLMPSPHYCSKWVRQRRVNFQLPHDLWWLHVNSQLPGRDIVPSWNYKKIRTNVYYDVKPPYLYEAQACNCTLSDSNNSSSNNDGKSLAGCGEDCINRLIYTECSPQLCPCKDSCSNQRIQRHEWAPGLNKFMTKDKGWGVKTKYSIKSGEFILEYVGEVVSEREFKNRMASRYQNDTHHYCLNLDGGLVIDGHRMGGDGRFVNHSCEPNCEMQKWSVNGLFRMALFALRDIEPHEELTYDYNFSLFNPAEGQPCKCGSSHCRGVIGGKYQRVQINVKENLKSSSADDDQHPSGSKSRKNARKGTAGRKPSKSGKESKEGKEVVKVVKEPVKETVVNNNNSNGLASVAMRLSHLLPLKPMTPQQQVFIRTNHVFLLRNFEKVKQLRERLKQVVRGTTVNSSAEPPAPPVAPDPQPGVFLSQLNALSTPRNIRTRRLAQAQENPEMTKTARLAYIFRHLFNAVAHAKEDNGGQLIGASFISMPSKRKLPLYYQRISEPIDLNTIEQNIVTGVYKTVESFDNDMNKLFANNVKFYGRTTDLGIAATRLRKIYNVAKLDFVSQLEEILGESPPASFVPEQEDPGGEEEDVIRCVCGLYKDEGLMIQCERCLVWQHCDCVKADTNAEHYLCERCNPRPVDLEIPLESNPEYATEGQTHYMTLLRGDLQLRQGDTVYVLRDIPNEETGTDSTPPSKHNYKTIKVINYNDCDIFKIERLWKDEKGDRFAFGHHYLRPHETYHEPTRKFFHNEVMRVPLYEVVPIELIMGHCYVLDLNTFCKGRPVGADPQHIYICEYRVDKYARLFARLARPKVPPVCVKSYAFEKFDTRLKISRTYTPHGPVNPKSSSTTSAVSRGRGGRTSTAHDHEDIPTTGSSSTTAASAGVALTHQLQPSGEDDEMPLARRSQQKQRLNSILLKLLARLPTKQTLDLSYLLEPGRRHRKRPAILSP